MLGFEPVPDTKNTSTSTSTRVDTKKAGFRESPGFKTLSQNGYGACR